METDMRFISENISKLDFLNTKIIMLKINLFYPIEYRRRVRNYMTLKIKVKVFEINGT